MTDTKLLVQRIEDSVAAKQALANDPDLLEAVADVANTVATALDDGGKVILFGNGGSAADAMHLAAEFLGRFSMDRRPLPALSLSDNVSAVTAIGNDFDYADVFERQVRALVSPGDVVIGLSTSGNSPNVARALSASRDGGATAVAFTGAAASACTQEADFCLQMPTTDTARVQECYMLLCHGLCELVERSLFAVQAT